MNKTIFLGLLFVAAVLGGCAATDENVAGGAINVRTGEQVGGDSATVSFYDGSNIQSKPTGLEFKVKDKVGGTGWRTMTLDRQGNLHVPADLVVNWNLRFGSSLARSVYGNGSHEDDPYLCLDQRNVVVESATPCGVNLMGDGNAYVCVDSSGELFRSPDPCAGLPKSIQLTMVEGETKTITIDGLDYEITAIYVSDPGQGLPEAKFAVNGFITYSVRQGMRVWAMQPLDGTTIDLFLIEGGKEGIVTFVFTQP